jgi:Holliday junction resolvasome RuvABC ATP-dependent DNA helicase subunit
MQQQQHVHHPSWDHTHKCLIVVGPGGVGKTCLSRQLQTELGGAVTWGELCTLEGLQRADLAAETVLSTNYSLQTVLRELQAARLLRFVAIWAMEINASGERVVREIC